MIVHLMQSVFEESIDKLSVGWCWRRAAVSVADGHVSGLSSRSSLRGYDRSSSVSQPYYAGLTLSQGNPANESKIEIIYVENLFASIEIFFFYFLVKIFKYPNAC